MQHLGFASLTVERKGFQPHRASNIELGFNSEEFFVIAQQSVIRFASRG